MARVSGWQNDLKITHSKKGDKERIWDDHHLVCDGKREVRTRYNKVRVLSWYPKDERVSSRWCV